MDLSKQFSDILQIITQKSMDLSGFGEVDRFRGEKKMKR